MGLSGECQALAALSPENDPLYRRLGGPQGWSGLVQKISSPPGFDPWTIQPLASCHTDYTVLAQKTMHTLCYVSNGKKGKRKCVRENRTWYQVTNYMVRSIHEFVQYTKMHAEYDVLISGKLQHPMPFWVGDAGVKFYCIYTKSRKCM
jgi:hypothetical protein